LLLLLLLPLLPLLPLLLLLLPLLLLLLLLLSRCPCCRRPKPARVVSSEPLVIHAGKAVCRPRPALPSCCGSAVSPLVLLRLLPDDACCLQRGLKRRSRRLSPTPVAWLPVLGWAGVPTQGGAACAGPPSPAIFFFSLFVITFNGEGP
jgi:hypothetical protein